MAFSPFAALTGSAYDAAIPQQQSYLAGQNANIANLISGATGAGQNLLQQGQNAALPAVNAGYTAAQNYIQGYTPQAVNALYQGQTQGANALTGALDPALAQIQGGVTSAVGAYDPLAAAAGRYGAAGTAASNMYANALGLNGPGGNAAATAAFQADPGYGFAVNQGLESILRNANASGMAASGNQLRASQTFGQGLADQQYQNWLKNTFGISQLYSPLEANALGQVGAGQAGAYLQGGTAGANAYLGTGSKLSDLYSGTGTNVATVLGGAGKSLADLASQGGLRTADIITQNNQAQADLLARMAAVQTGYTQAAAPTYASTYGAQAAADTGASANLWNLGIAGAKAYAGAGMPGVSTLGSMMPSASNASQPAYGPFPRIG